MYPAALAFFTLLSTFESNLPSECHARGLTKDMPFYLKQANVLSGSAVEKSTPSDASAVVVSKVAKMVCFILYVLLLIIK